MYGLGALFGGHTARPDVASTKGVSVEGSVPDKAGNSQSKANVNIIDLDVEVTPLAECDEAILSNSQSCSDVSVDDENVDNDGDVGNVISICCPLAQLATLSYIDVALKTDSDSQDQVVKGLVDTGAQVRVVKASWLPYPKPEVYNTIQYNTIFV